MRPVRNLVADGLSQRRLAVTGGADEDGVHAGREADKRHLHLDLALTEGVVELGPDCSDLRDDGLKLCDNVLV